MTPSESANAVIATLQIEKRTLVVSPPTARSRCPNCHRFVGESGFGQGDQGEGLRKEIGEPLYRQGERSLRCLEVLDECEGALRFPFSGEVALQSAPTL